MRTEQILKNAKLVTPDEVVRGSLAISNGRVKSLDNGSLRGAARDMEGDYLLPGLIEMHTDNLERHMVPRPGVQWPSALSAALAHDAEIISAGITTVLDSVYVGTPMRDRNSRAKLLKASIQAIHLSREQGLERAEHLLHLRCEFAGENVIEQLAPHIDEPILALVSLMDHTPGQRQWADLPKWRLYHRDKQWNDDEARKIVDQFTAMQREFAEPNRRAIVEMCRRRGLPMASHDDTTTEHVDEAHDMGISISEFPTTLAAAQKAASQGMHVVGGSPNLVRGESHSGNVSVRDLAQNGVMDCLSSDYVPRSLLHGLFYLHQAMGLPLHQAVALASAAPARALDLSDRGRLVPGLRADLVRVRLVEGFPVVAEVWREGGKVF